MDSLAPRMNVFLGFDEQWATDCYGNSLINGEPAADPSV
eukprot:CAMPEP_0197050130 /NCGR_PEP_ID=MMETSP1384-20130603/25104_1 /TAXON_ID=29189 /ORGANISM="Ammonia sp." /LENGTH=38 /DNA_ID= /DNA_START= /DNA_END= /DNA_ORIENTATION=